VHKFITNIFLIKMNHQSKAKAYIVVFAVILLSFTMGVVKADIYVDILGGDEQRIPIVVLPFDVQTKKELKHKMDKIVLNDLSRSGLFSLIEAPVTSHSFSSNNDVGYKFFRKLGAENIIAAQIKDNGPNSYLLRVSLYDVLLKKKKWTYSWGFSSKQLRQSAHQISDLIFKEITGKESAFSSNLAFITVQKNKKNRRIYRLQIADSDGFDAKTVLKSTDPILSPAWSPNGQRLAYTSFENGRSEIYIHHLQTGKRELVASYKGINGSPAWSPDGESLAMTLSMQGNSEIYIMNLLTKKLRRLTKNPSIDTEANFSHNGKYVYFTSNRKGKPQIYRLNMYTGRTEQVTKIGEYNAGSSISKDGKYLALIHSSEKKLRVALYDIENEEFHPITDTFLDDSPSISPGANMLVYSSIDRINNNGQLVIMDLRARSKTSLKISNGTVKEPAWGPARQITFKKTLN
jgi:TolB protein